MKKRVWTHVQTCAQTHAWCTWLIDPDFVVSSSKNSASSSSWQEANSSFRDIVVLIPWMVEANSWWMPWHGGKVCVWVRLGRRAGMCARQMGRTCIRCRSCAFSSFSFCSIDAESSMLTCVQNILVIDVESSMLTCVQTFVYTGFKHAIKICEDVCIDLCAEIDCVATQA